MPLVDVKYKYNQSILSVLGCGDNKKIRLTTLERLRTAGLDTNDEYVKKGTVNSKKLDNSISRTKRKIHELAFCNPWDMFGTFTLDKSKYDRCNLKKYQKDFAQFIRDQRKKHDSDIKYLLIPELHKDMKTWHMHGLFFNIPHEILHQFVVGDTMGKEIAQKVLKGDIVYDWLAYKQKFGFCSFEPIRNQEAVSNYLKKYITKDLCKSVTEVNAHMYFSSQGLKMAEKWKKGTLKVSLDYDFSNEYCKIKTMPYTEELLNFLLANIDEEYY